ncbi:hypothetical protein VP01_136g1 [Puccinia sorghi]|uniref:Uncharacterized protein n=1 Tax=Puccinia sorghi TaxID=27349 RepID=A0A0L6VNJ4_9BASI|nr:hypothetical protein VP01_136g1 [Puccinia sorghi]
MVGWIFQPVDSITCRVRSSDYPTCNLLGHFLTRKNYSISVALYRNPPQPTIPTNKRIVKWAPNSSPKNQRSSLSPVQVAIGQETELSRGKRKKEKEENSIKTSMLNRSSKQAMQRRFSCKLLKQSVGNYQAGWVPVKVGKIDVYINIHWDWDWVICVDYFNSYKGLSFFFTSRFLNSWLEKWFYHSHSSNHLFFSSKKSSSSISVTYFIFQTNSIELKLIYIYIYICVFSARRCSHFKLRSSCNQAGLDSLSFFIFFSPDIKIFFFRILVGELVSERGAGGAGFLARVVQRGPRKVRGVMIEILRTTSQCWQFWSKKLDLKKLLILNASFHTQGADLSDRNRDRYWGQEMELGNLEVQGTGTGVGNWTGMENRDRKREQEQESTGDRKGTGTGKVEKNVIILNFFYVWYHCFKILSLTHKFYPLAPFFILLWFLIWNLLKLLLAFLLCLNGEISSFYFLLSLIRFFFHSFCTLTFLNWIIHPKLVIILLEGSDFPAFHFFLDPLLIPATFLLSFLVVEFLPKHQPEASNNIMIVFCGASPIKFFLLVNKMDGSSTMLVILLQNQGLKKKINCMLGYILKKVTEPPLNPSIFNLNLTQLLENHNRSSRNPESQLILIISFPIFFPLVFIFFNQNKPTSFQLQDPWKNTLLSYPEEAIVSNLFYSLLLNKKQNNIFLQNILFSFSPFIYICISSLGIQLYLTNQYMRVGDVDEMSMWERSTSTRNLKKVLLMRIYLLMKGVKVNDESEKWSSGTGDQGLQQILFQEVVRETLVRYYEVGDSIYKGASTVHSHKAVFELILNIHQVMISQPSGHADHLHTYGSVYEGMCLRSFDVSMQKKKKCSTACS